MRAPDQIEQAVIEATQPVNVQGILMKEVALRRSKTTFFDQPNPVLKAEAIVLALIALGAVAGLNAVFIL